MLSKRDGHVRRLEYPPLAGTGAQLSASPVEDAERIAQLQSQMEERERQLAAAVESARAEAFQKGRNAAAGEQIALRQECSAQLRAATEEFRAHSDDYFARAEHEVVRLALAVAERILHREAQMDPLLLSGAVRVALGQLAESAKVRLRVPPEHLEMWTEMVRLVPGLPVRPDVETDPSLKTGEVYMESSLGRVDLGVRTQLEEVERVFFDGSGSRNGAAEGAAWPEAAGKKG